MEGQLEMFEFGASVLVSGLASSVFHVGMFLVMCRLLSHCCRLDNCDVLKPDCLVGAGTFEKICIPSSTSWFFNPRGLINA